MTEAGQRIYDHCQILFKQIDRARLDVAGAIQRPTEPVIVGMPHSLMAILALPPLKAATEKLPDVRIELKQEQSRVLAGALRSQKLDLTVITAGSMASPSRKSTHPN